MSQDLPKLEQVLNYNKEFIKELEAARIDALEVFNANKVFRNVLAVLLIIGLVLVVKFGSDSAISFYIFGLTFGIPILLTLMPVLIGNHYDRDNVEFQVVSAVLNSFDADLEYLLKNHIPSPAIQKGELIFMRYDQLIKGKKYIRGYYKQSYFQTSFIYLGSSDKSYFQAIPGRKKKFNYLIVDFNKSFQSKTLVMQDRYEKKLGFVAHHLQNIVSDGKLAKLEHADFENTFLVFTNDQIEARYLLSTTMMEKLLELNKKYKGGVEAAFVDDAIHLWMGKREPFFNYSFGFNEDIETLFEKVYKEVYDLFSLVETLELNQKLWSKQ